MLKMIIVDDEYIILESLKTLIDWESVGVEVVGSADNGAAAIDLTMKQQPDIILSDIAMPFFSGLEMLETLRKNSVTAEVIFISAYSRFDYAREALKHGAFDYILKPINETLLLETVDRCAKKIISKQSETPPADNSTDVWVTQISGGLSACYEKILQEPPRKAGGFAELRRAVVEHIRSGEIDAAADLLLDFFRLIAIEDSILDADAVKLRCIELLDYILRKLEDYKLEDYLENSQKALSAKKSITVCTGLDSAYDVTRNLIMNIGLCVREIQSHGSKRLINLAVSYIQENYQKDITLSQTAQQLYISPSYLSKIFSAEMQETFSHYLQSYRINVAKTLLRDTHLKIYEIAAQSGYTDVAHFSKSFKQLAGTTPIKYRDKAFLRKGI